jgi:hypothetical protein
MVLKRKYSGRYQTTGKRARTMTMVRKSYPIYQNVFTAPAPRRVELKYDIGAFSTLISSVPAVIVLSNIANGSGSTQRIGKRIQYHDIEFNWFFIGSNSNPPNVCRFWIVYDTAPNGITPAYTDILSSSAVTCVLNPDTRARYKVLYDSMAYVHYDNTSGQSGSDSSGNLGKKVVSLRGKYAQFTGTTDTMPDMEKGSIYCVTNSFSNNKTYLEFTNKIQFSDA